MRAVLLLAILSTMVALVYPYFLQPNILSPHSSSKKVVCEAYPTKNPNPYLQCVNDAIIKVSRAVLAPSTPKQCPLQYTDPSQRPVQCVSEIDVTEYVKELCDTKEDCFFYFSQLPSLTCDSSPDFYQGITVDYVCEPLRKRMRPFANKRYSPKFSRTINHPIRKLSYNHLMALEGTAGLPVGPLPVGPGPVGGY